jgi:hypothetical protein
MLDRLAIVAILLAIGVTAARCVPVWEEPADDRWRRTANGWERMDWKTPAAYAPAPVPPPPNPPRYDIHPAVLALVQILAATLVFSLFPPAEARRQAALSQTLF